jgi:hypothetical protein
MARNLVLEQYSPEQRQQITRFEVARGQEREDLKQLPGPEGNKLISGFESKVREVRLRMRFLDPELDAWAYFFGLTDTFVTKKSETTYNDYTDRFLNLSMME